MSRELRQECPPLLVLSITKVVGRGKKYSEQKHFSCILFFRRVMCVFKLYLFTEKINRSLRVIAVNIVVSFG